MRTQSHKRTELNFDLKHGEGSSDKLRKLAERGMLVEDMAREFGTSKQNISNKLKAVLGMTYREYRQNKSSKL